MHPIICCVTVYAFKSFLVNNWKFCAKLYYVMNQQKYYTIDLAQDILHYTRRCTDNFITPFLVSETFHYSLVIQHFHFQTNRNHYKYNLKHASPSHLLRGKKTPPFYFCNNFCQILLYWNNYQQTYKLINLEQNDIKIVDLLLRMSLYCLAKCSICTHVMTNIGFVT